MSEELRLYNPAQEQYLTDLTSAVRREHLRYPSLWDSRDPESQSKMLRDAVIGHAVDHRCGKIAGRQWSLTPRDNANPRSALAVAVGTELVGAIKNFPGARKSLARSFFYGGRYGVCNLATKPLDIGDGIVRNWVVVNRIQDENQFRYRKVFDDPYGDNPKAHWEKWRLIGKDSGQWVEVSERDAVRIIHHVYDDTEESIGYGKGLHDALAYLWYTMVNTNQEAIGAIEAFARGRLIAKVDLATNAGTGKSNEAVFTEYTNALKRAQARHIFTISKDDELDVLSGGGDGWQMIDAFLDRLERRVMTLVLSANLPTGGGSKNGSLARAEVEEDSTESLIQFDRALLEETLTDSLVGCLWQKNAANLVELGIENEKPRFSLTQEKIEDPERVAGTAAILNGMGMDLSLEDLHERTNFKKPEPGEEIIAGAVAPPAPGMGGFGFGGGDPFGAGVPT